MKDKRILVSKYLYWVLSRDGDALAHNIVSVLSDYYQPKICVSKTKTKGKSKTKATDTTKRTAGVAILHDTHLNWVLSASPAGLEIYLVSTGSHLLVDDKPPRLTIKHVTTDVLDVVNEYCEMYAYSMCDRSIDAVYRHILNIGLW